MKDYIGAFEQTRGAQRQQIHRTRPGADEKHCASHPLIPAYRPTRLRNSGTGCAALAW